MVPEAGFVRKTLGTTSATWNPGRLIDIAGAKVPDSVLGRRGDLLRADINLQWAEWFAEGFADPRRYLKLTYVRLFSDVFIAVQQTFQNYTKPEQLEVARAIASFLNLRTERFRERRSRTSISREQRLLLIDLLPTPRCWICGAEFRVAAIDNFVDGAHHVIQTPPFVDIFKPIGLSEQDFRIEVDHVQPFSEGGADEDNLRLACGWCNRHKSSYLSLYDVAGSPRLPGPNTIGVASLPQPFWTVRVIAALRQCEDARGCASTADSAEMTVAPINSFGALNPPNLRVTCYEHDPLRGRRLQPTAQVRSMWTGRETNE
jgi:hypothetical protein